MQSATTQNIQNDNHDNITDFYKKINKTENILSAMLLVVEAEKNDRSQNVPSTTRISNTNDVSVDLSSRTLQVLLSEVESLVYLSIRHYYQDRLQVLSDLSQMTFYINALKMRGSLSETNHSALTFAYSSMIEAYRHVYGDHTATATQWSITDKSLKDIDLKLSDDVEEDTRALSTQNKIIVKDIIQPESAKKSPQVTESHRSHITTVNSALQPVYSDRHKASADRQGNRRSEILKILSRSPITIKDISNQILGCSEKTIQRELNSLLEDGVIDRVGEKRWSKYLIK